MAFSASSWSRFRSRLAIWSSMTAAMVDTLYPAEWRRFRSEESCPGRRSSNVANFVVR